MPAKKNLVYVLYYLSLLSTLALLAQTSVLGNFFKEFSAFLLGDKEIARSGNMVLFILTVVGAQTILDAAGVVLGNLFSFENKSCAYAFSPSRKELVISSTMEEILFRWVPLGALTTLPLLSGNIAFYFLFLSSNAIWALMHLNNFNDKRFTPEKGSVISNIFIFGLLLGFLFVKFGLFAVIAAHVSLNMVYFELNKGLNKLFGK